MVVVGAEAWFVAELLVVGVRLDHYTPRLCTHYHSWLTLRAIAITNAFYLDINALKPTYINIHTLTLKS